MTKQDKIAKIIVATEDKLPFFFTVPPMVKLGKKQQPIEIIGVEKHGDTDKARIVTGKQIGRAHV